MSVVDLKSISGITSITTPASDNQLTLHTNNTTERLRINSSGNVQVNGGAVHIDANGELAVFETDTNLAFTNSAKIAFDYSGNIARIRSSHNGSGTTRNLGLYIGNSQKLLITSSEITAAVQVNIESAGSYIKSNQLKFNPSGHAYIDHGVTSKDITFRLSNSSALDFNAITIDSSAQQTKFGKQIVVGLQGGNDVTTIGGGSGIGAYIQLDHASSGINTKLMGNNDSYLNQFHGNLAIGEDDPDGNKLLIRAASTVGTTKGHIMLTGDGATNGEGPQIVFSESGSGSNFAGAYIGHIREGSNSTGSLVFGTRATGGDANTVPTERLRIWSSGQATFDKGAPGSANQVIARFQAESSRRLDIVWHDSGSLMGFDTPSNHSYIFKINGSEKVRITSTGQVELSKSQDGVTGRPTNRIVFKDTDTSVAAEQPIGEISWYSTDAGMANVNSYIRGINEATNGSGALTFGVKAAGSSEIEALRITSGGVLCVGATAADGDEFLRVKNKLLVMNTANLGDAFVKIKAGESGGSVLEFEADEGDDYADLWRIQNAGDGLLGFRTKSSGSWVEKLRITSTDVTINGSTDGVLNLNTTDSRGSFIRFQQGTNTRCWVGSGHGMGLGDDDDLGLMATDKIRFNSVGSERLIIDGSNVRHGHSNVIGGGLDSVRINNGAAYRGTVLRGTGGSGGMANYDEYCFLFNRMGTDGSIITFNAQGSQEGSISVSGSSVSYNGGVLTRWSQLVGISTNVKSDRPTIYQGTVMSNLDEMCEWTDEENMQLNKTQVSTASGDKNVAGVFWAWDDDDDVYTNDFYVAQTGDFIVRVGAATTITRGDLLESAGDGTAKPQSDDIIRSKTVAKVTSGIAHTTYPDGTKTYPCVLMAS